MNKYKLLGVLLILVCLALTSTLEASEKDLFAEEVIVSLEACEDKVKEYKDYSSALEKSEQLCYSEVNSLRLGNQSLKRSYGGCMKSNHSYKEAIEKYKLLDKNNSKTIEELTEGYDSCMASYVDAVEEVAPKGNFWRNVSATLFLFLLL